ncbi:MAG: hypothetical protein FWG57_09175 [Endomicrobia bacterium]|nr:hypothetical protein [Endomicrobiia bacterium]
MKKEEKLIILKESFSILKYLAKNIDEKIKNAQEGIKDENINLIIGGLNDIDTTAKHIQNIYETMLLIHKNN